MLWIWTMISKQKHNDIIQKYFAVYSSYFLGERD